MTYSMLKATLIASGARLASGLTDQQVAHENTFIDASASLNPRSLS